MTKKTFKTLITLLVALMMTAVMAFVTACDNSSTTDSSSDSSSSSTSTTVDEHTLLNGNFEYYAEKDSVSFPYKTSIKWVNTRGSIVSSSDYAPSSDGASGIIDTSDDKFAELQSLTFGNETIGTYLTTNPHSPSYYGFTEKDENIPANGTGNRVLMIHNRLKNNAGQGTAQYFYTSGSTLSLEAGTYGKLTAWVNTMGLASEMKTEEFGAYIKLVNKVSSTEAGPVMVKNINTDGNWAKVEIYLEANELASSTYTLYLGLGIGSENVTAEYVEGFAFFDDVTFETIEEDEYLTGTNGVTNVANAFGVDGQVVVLDTDQDDFNLAGTTYTANATNNTASYTTEKFISSHKSSKTPTTPSIAEKTFNEDAFAYDTQHKTDAKNVPVGLASSAIINVKDDKAFTDEEGYNLFENESFFYFDYTDVSSSFTVDLSSVTLKMNERVLISFWAKVKVNNLNATGLTVNVRDLGAEDAGGNLVITDEDEYKDTAIISAVTETTDEKNGWMQYNVIIENTKKAVDTATGIEAEEEVPKRRFSLEITFGPTDSKLTDKNLFPEGYALVGAFKSAMVSEDVAKLLTVSSTVSLSAEILNSTTEATDSYTFLARENEIKAGVLSQPLSTLKAYDVNGAKPAYSGIFNTEYVSSINSIALVSGGKQLIELQTPTNKYVQALAIGSPAGYYTGKSTVSANSVAKITVKLTTIGDATAYVNVLDRDSDPIDASKGYNVLSLNKDSVKTTTLLSANPLENDVVFSKAVKATTESDGTYKWHTVTFYIAAGTEEINFGVEIWNGERFANDPVNGLVIVDSISVSTSDTSTFESIKASADEKGSLYTESTFGYKVYNYDINDKDTPIYEEDEDNEVNEHTNTVNADLGLVFELNTSYEYELFANFLATNYEDKAYVEVKDETETDTDTTASDSTSTEEDEDHDHEHEHDEELPGEVQWLAISSVAIAVVLIVALLAVIIRFFVKKTVAKKVKTSSYYDANARERANERIRANKAKRAVQAVEEDEEEAYDYDEASNIEETEAEEVVEEATDAPVEAEEVVEESADVVETAEVTEQAPATEETTEETTEEKKD